MFSWNRNSSRTDEAVIGAEAHHPMPISPVILTNESAETEIGAKAIVSKSGGEETAMVRTRTTSSSVVPNMVYCNDEGPSAITHSHMQDSAVNGILQLQRSPNGNLYQNFYVEEQPGTQQLDQCMVNMFSASTDADTQAAEVATNLNHHFEYESQDVNDENSVELMAQFAANLANVANEQLYSVDCREQEERILLHSTMSPLLAAVNDITKRDMELQLYLNQNLENQTLNVSEAVPGTEDQANEVLISANAVNKYGEEEVSNEDHEEECSLVTDNPVECRAKASLPTRYLKFGAIDSITNEPSIYAKKPISHNTKFGPLEGEVLYANDIEMDVLHVQTPRYYPLLLVDESHILDVSNENNSNWMRYVRLAETYTQQNLHLLLQNGNIYFRTLRCINAKEELRIGYHQLYATRFLLPIMSPPTTNLEFKENKASKWQQKIISKNRVSKLNSKSPTASPMPANLKRQRKSCLGVVAHKQSNSPQKKKRKKKREKLPSKELRRFMYKCNLCAKRFYTEQKLELHKTNMHDKNLTKPHMCHVCQQQCATPTALAAHILSHTCSLYTCVYCKQQFKYVRDFKKHASEHQTLQGTYQCLHCNKHYVAYHLVRKHVRIFHAARKFSCSQCDKKFQNINNLQRHQLIHMRSRLEKCTQCNRAFSRRDQLKAHVKRVHIKDGNREWNDIKCKDVVSKPSEELKMHINAKNSSAKVEDTLPPNLDEIQMKSCTTTGTTSQNYYQKNMNTVKDVDRYLMKVTPQKLLTNVTSSSSNRRRQKKQTPTKLKAVDLNAETVTYVALSEMLTPFLIAETEQRDEFKTCEKLHQKRNFVAIQQDKEKGNDTNAEKALQEYQEKNENNAASTNNFNYNATDTTTFTATNNELLTINPLYPFKCHLCPNINFKRRGILVNHFARVHQQVDLNDIECLNAPLIKPQFIFACPYCSRTYKSKAKRKSHMLKHHPTQELLPILNAQVVGNIEAQVHRCQHCPRQYAARNRLISHLRKMHPEEKIPKLTKEYRLLSNGDCQCKEKEKVCIESSTQFLEPEINITSYVPPPPPPPPPTCVSPENKLLKLSSAALELSRFDFLNERSGGADDLNRLPALFDETALTGIDGGSLMERYNHRSIEMQFFEKIGKL